jgi:uncharacterized protein YbjT (DUF2867 family)
MNIVVTGSLGHVGQPLVRLLVGSGHRVTVISHSHERAAAITSLGATPVIGSLEDPKLLTAAFANAEAAFLMVPPNFAELDQVAYYRRVVEHYRAAIAASGVKRLVYLSSYGAHLPKDTGFILGAHHAETLLNELKGVSLTHLRAGYFYYNLYNFAEVIRHTGRIFSNFGGTDLLPLVSPADIAQAAAEELTKPSGDNVRYVVSEELTASQTAGVLGAAIGLPALKWDTLSDAEVLQAMTRNGLPERIAGEFVALGAALHSGALLGHYRDNPPKTLGAVKLKDFAAEFAHAYAKGAKTH